MDIAAYMAEVGQQARAAATGVARSTTAVRNQALLATAEALDAAREELAHVWALHGKQRRRAGEPSNLLYYTSK